MATLMYPLDLNRNQNDFIKFEHFPYELNKKLRERGYDRDGTINPDKYPESQNKIDYAPQVRDSNSIVLYMPNSTPATHYGHEATYQTFPGPLGQFGKQFLGALGGDYSGGIDGIGKEIRNQADLMRKNTNFSGAAYQYAVKQVAGLFGADAATALALGQNKLYNPNAEMIYKQPFHRKFNLTFDFTPKSREEAEEVDKIIYEFKRWSAPKFDGDAGSGFMQMPHLWRISYHESSGQIYRRMNLFKPSLITNFVAQDNPQSDFHITIKDEEKGHVPVHTAINIFMQETMPPTREDHKWAVENGYRRGY